MKRIEQLIHEPMGLYAIAAALAMYEGDIVSCGGLECSDCDLIDLDMPCDEYMYNWLTEDIE